MKTGTEYVQNSGECPYCGSDEIDGGINNSFEGVGLVTPIHDGVLCGTSIHTRF